MFSSSTRVGEVSACMSCGRGEWRLGNRLSVYVIFIFLRDWEYHVSSAVCLGGCTPSEVGWSPSEVCCALSEVFVIWSCIWAGMSTGVLARVSR